jgi:hypothetical protein
MTTDESAVQLYDSRKFQTTGKWWRKTPSQQQMNQQFKTSNT